MGWITHIYRSQITAKGRPVRLQRGDTDFSVSVTGCSAPASLSAEHMVGDNLGDIEVTLMAADLLAKGWKDQPEQSDSLEINERTYGIRLATPIYDGAELCAWRILAVGGLRGESYG